MRSHLLDEMRVRSCFAFTVTTLTLGVALIQNASHAAQPVQTRNPQPLSFKDLVELATENPAAPAVEARLNRLLSEPFISNQASLSGAKPIEPDPPEQGRFLRVAEWNINREDNQSMLLALSDWRAYQKLAQKNPHLHTKDLKRAVEEARYLEDADIIVLNEVDKGDKRTGYRDVTRDLAERLHMNYVFATEFIELTPLYLGLQKMDEPDLPRQKRESEQYGVDPKRYLGLEGSALLSRYRIRSAKIVHLPAAYDWYKGEIGAISKITKADKWTAEKLFDEREKRQVRRGDRLMIVAELEVPGSPGGVLTVVCPHLEDYTEPKGRRKQMDFVLEQIKSIKTPVVVAGDFNTMGHNAAPVTGKRLVKDYLLNIRFWARQAFYLVVPVPGLSYSVEAFNYYKNFHDPTAPSIPIFASNGDQGLFSDLSKFRFDDGSRFEWAGIKKDSYGRKGRTLSITNQRSWKGFEPTYEFARTYHGLVGTYKLDWILVKRPEIETAELKPSQGRTLRLLNKAPEKRISDHAPTALDLALDLALDSTAPSRSVASSKH